MLIRIQLHCHSHHNSASIFLPIVRVTSFTIFFSPHVFLQLYLNNLGNYIPDAWNSTEGCLVCKEWAQQLPEDRENWPEVLLAIFIERPSPFLTEMLERVALLDYPKEKMTLLVHNAVSFALLSTTHTVPKARLFTGPCLVPLPLPKARLLSGPCLVTMFFSLLLPQARLS